LDTQKKRVKERMPFEESGQTIALKNRTDETFLEEVFGGENDYIRGGKRGRSLKMKRE